jgi:hypothetical protein
MRLPVLLALGCGMAIFWAGYTDAYFPQNDVFSYYQLFHYTYSAALLNQQIPLWEPYASYGIPSAFELAFTFGPTKCAAALLGILFGITDIKALFFGAIAADFALLGLASAWLVRDLTGTAGPHVCLVAALMPLSHNFESTTNFGYGFALTMVFVLLFLLRFLQTRRGLYLAATGMTLVANIYGNPQYLVIPEAYLAVLFLLMAGLRFRRQLPAEWRAIARSLFSIPSIALGALTAGLLLGLLLIDREILNTVKFTPLDRDFRTMKPSLEVFLYYVPAMPFRRLPDLFTGRPITTPDIWLYFGLSALTVLLFAFRRGWRIKFVPELLILVLLTTTFSLPTLFPVAKWAYYFAPGMSMYRPANFASVFAKPFAILAVAVVLYHPVILEEKSRRHLLNVSLATLLFAGILQSLQITAWYYFDAFAYGWIAIGALLVLLVVLHGLKGPRWERWAPLVLAFILVGEIAIHRIVFEETIYNSLAIRPSPNYPTELLFARLWNPFEPTLYYDLFPQDRNVIRIKPWYKWPRRLIYQSTRFQPVPYPIVFPFSDYFDRMGTLYHGLWSFLGLDPCIPITRSDSYARWIATGLEQRGVAPLGLSRGQLYGSAGNPPYGLGSDFDAAYGCDQPKLTIDDPAGTTQMERFTANEASIIVRTPAGGTLTYRDAWTPGWQAVVDGVPAPLARNRDGFKMLVVPRGNHRVDLVFRPFVGEGDILALAILLTISVMTQVWLLFWGPRDLPAI